MTVNRLPTVPLNIVLTKIISSDQQESNPFESAMNEQRIVEQKQIEKQNQINSFKRLVKNRIKLYKKCEREVNEDAKLARHQKRLIHNKQSPIKIIKDTNNISKIDVAKQNLASKCVEKPSDNADTVLPGGNWNSQAPIAKAPTKLIKTVNEPTTSKALKYKRPRSLSPNSLPDFVLRSLVRKTENDNHNLVQLKKRIHDTRKIFSDLERDKTKSDLKSINTIKSNNEKKRLLEEKRIEDIEVEISQHFQEQFTKIQIESNQSQANSNHNRQDVISRRYIDALRNLIKEKAEKNHIILPPLCQCSHSSTIWEFNPNNCANNCIFYKNPKEYEKALQSLLIACDLK